MKRIWMVAACAAMTGSMVAQQHTHMTDSLHRLEEVEIVASPVLPGGLLNQQARVGILGSGSVLDLPYSQMSLTRKTIELFNDATASLGSVLQQNPSIRISSSSPMYSDFSMRGINMNGNHMMLNGVPSLFYQFNTPPAHMIERIEITSGPNAGINGVSMSNNGTDSGATPAPGTINVVSKRAEDTPINSYKALFSGRGNMAVFTDFGRRWGKQKQWGVRINGEYMDGELALKGTEKNEKNIFVNVDHRGKNSTTNVLVGLFELRVNEGQRWFTFGGSGATLPKAPTSGLGYDFKETTKHMKGNLLTLNHEHKLGRHLTAFFNLGHNHRSGTKYNSQANLRFNDEGAFESNNKSNAQNEAGNNFYTQVGIRGNLQTGCFNHTLSLAADYSRATYDNKSNAGAAGKIGGDLYKGVVHGEGFYPLPRMLDAQRAWKEKNVGITALYSVSFKDKVSLLLGASQKNEDFHNYTTKQDFKNHNILPTFGLTVRPLRSLSLYYGHTESFSRGAYVSDSKYINKGETLAPSRSKQDEVGIKWENKAVVATLSFFDIKQTNYIDVTEAAGLRRAADGLNRHRGAELTATGHPFAGLSFTGGLLYLDAKREKTKDGAADGKFVNGAAKFSGALGVEYLTRANIGFVARGTVSGQSFIDSKHADGKTEIPAYGTLDAGVNYSFRTGFGRMKLNAMCYNVANKSYWHGRGGSTTFGLSMPRTFAFSAQLDF